MCRLDLRLKLIPLLPPVFNIYIGYRLDGWTDRRTDGPIDT